MVETPVGAGPRPGLAIWGGAGVQAGSQWLEGLGQVLWASGSRAKWSESLPENVYITSVIPILPFKGRD